MIRVRVRGIYATALSQVLVDRGFMLADVSDVLRDRLRQPVVEGPAEITVKSVDDDADTLLVLGSPWDYGREVEEAIVEELRYVSVRRGRLGLYTVVDAVSLGDCKALLPGGVEGLVQGECPPKGEVIRGYVVKESLSRGDPVVVRSGVALVGLYTTVYTPGDGFSFSEHVRDDARRLELVESIKAEVDISRVHVRFRSNSKYGEPVEVASEARSLAEMAMRLASDPPQREPRILARGEYISLIYITSPAKSLLDNIRSKIHPTIEYHHSLKAGGFEESSLVDFSEESLRLGYATSRIGLAIISYIASNLKGRKVTIDHRIPDGRRASLGPFTVDSYTVGDSVRMVLTRVFKTPGTLDGLNVEKKPGDYSRTIIDTREWHTIHEYYSKDGKLLGVYVNINTPAEIGFKSIRYLDLYIDVIKKPGEEPEIKDSEELERALQENLVTRDLYEEAVEEAERVARRIAQLYRFSDNSS